ncbi:MAG: carboxypeptidase-like regulatory domain-containing protein, partial [Bacteroidales bacterium]|nr:carboxypeptidase-like regulatory domain-containing protein [Bacteroidales bacterium]
MKRLLTLLMLVLLTTAAIAQDRITISGKVLDKSNGDPLIGVNIVQQGTTNGTISDIDGKFSLSVDKNSIVLISYIGYKAQELVANSEKELKLFLEEDLTTVEEVVVIGYGTQKKSVVTAAISGISADD